MSRATSRRAARSRSTARAVGAAQGGGFGSCAGSCAASADVRCAPYGGRVAYDGTLPFRVLLDGEAVASETSFAWAGAYSLTVATALPHLAVELHSGYVGHPGVPTA